LWGSWRLVGKRGRGREGLSRIALQGGACRDRRKAIAAAEIARAGEPFLDQRQVHCVRRWIQRMDKGSFDLAREKFVGPKVATAHWFGECIEEQRRGRAEQP
jgi:hypothetical protein